MVIRYCPARRPGSIDKVNKLAEEINSSGGWAKGFGVDARDEDAIQSFFKEVEEEIAPIDVVILIQVQMFFFQLKILPQGSLERYGRWQLLQAF